MNNEKLRSRPVLKLCLFAGIGSALSLALILYCAFSNDDPMVIRVIVWICCGIFLAIGLVILWVQLFHFVEIKNGNLIVHKGFLKKTIRFSDIEKIENKDGLFDIYVAQKRVATLSTDDKSTQQILLLLEKKHVKIHWR